MQIQLITTTEKKEEWNRLACHPLETWEWGEVKKNTGNEIYRLGRFDEKEKLIEILLISLHKVPFGYSIAYSARSVWPSPAILVYAQKLLRSKNCIFLKLEPNVFAEEAGVYRIPLLKKVWTEERLRFVLSNSRVFATHTFIVDLSFSEDKLLAQMKPKTRYNIRLAQKKGVVVKDESENKHGFDIFFKLYTETLRRQNYLGHDRSYQKTVWRYLGKKIARILIAYYKGEPLAAYQLFFFKDRAYYVYGGSSSKHKEVMASNLLMWESLRLAKRLKCQTFDMWGALPKDYNPADPWAGFHRFKEGYGGRHKSYIGSIDIVLKPLEYRVFSLLWPIRYWLLQLKQKLSF